MTREIDDDLKAALKSIIDEFENDEKAVRERQIRIWKKLEYYWFGFTRIYWDGDIAHDWRIFDDGYGYETNDAGYYDKPVNVFRAYLESIIAALSSTVPAIKCVPDDADNESDVLTARGGTKIAELIYKHVDAPLLWVRALWVYCTQGMIAAYNYTVEDEKFGSVQIHDYEDSEETKSFIACPNCGTELTDQNLDSSLELMMQELNEFDPNDDDAKLHSSYAGGKILCPTCAIEVDPELKNEKVIVQRLTGVTNKAKSRQGIKVEGGLFIKVPNWARCQADTPYLAYNYETHYSNVYKDFPHLREEMPNLDVKVASSDGNQLYERWGRLSPQYYGEYPRSTPTVRKWWLRPSAFEVCKDEELRKKLYKKFPDGCYTCWVNECFASAENEALDDHWTLTFNPLSEYIHFDPLGMLLTSIQEMTQDLLALTLQTVEHGVPQVFADPSVVNFDQYRQTEIAPGSIYPAKPKSGKALSDAFYMISTATLSQSVEPFAAQVQSLGQFVSGALPSLFGGEQAGSSRTAAQYSMSRNQALQRLQTTWKMINYWWAAVFSKAIPAYIKTMLDDEKIAREEHGTFINTVIKKAELDGKIGDVEVESSDTLPSTWGQVQDIIMQLINTNNPEILQALSAPENMGILQEGIGLTNFSIPGEKDREKQYEEIQQLLRSAPIPGMPDPQTGQPQMTPSVMPELEVDNHQVEGEICRFWLVGESGRQAKIDNPQGYQNVLLHLKIHIQMLQQLQAPQQTGPQGPQGNGNQPNRLKPIQKPMNQGNANANGNPQPTVQ